MKNIQKIAHEMGTPLLLFSRETFRNSYLELCDYLPGVKHHFALKALPHTSCIEVIHELGGYLDLATRGEIELVKKSCPEILDRSIVTHPIKSKADLEYMSLNKINTIIIDSLSELEKVIPHKNKMQVLIRIAFSNELARQNLSKKFGVNIDEVPSLLERALELNISIVGCCFHVGSQMPSPELHVHAIKECHNIYKYVREYYNIDWKILDIGGGFPIQLDSNSISLEEYCRPIKISLNQYFPRTEIWSEPGRCLAGNSAKAICQVIGKTTKNGKIWYSLDDGVYGLYSANIYDHAKFIPQALSETNSTNRLSVLSGPSCDSIDILAEDIWIPEMEIGDYMYCNQMGAYTWATRTDFNMCNPIKWKDVEFEFAEMKLEFTLN